MLYWSRRRRISFSLTPSSFDRRASEKPLRFILRNTSWFKPAKPPAFTSASSFTSSSICTRNQRSMLVRLNTPSTDIPARKASAMYQIRSAPASFSS
ncbi:Uncharacterised protein [Vibrio cholerae]|nr:Uncharacterised protein [Vibrio cholerae]